MVRAQRGLFERQSLEENVLVAEGEDLSGSCKCLLLVLVNLSLIVLF